MAATARQRASFAVNLDKPITPDEKKEICEAAQWLIDHDGKVEDWEIDANPIIMERLGYLYVRCAYQRGDNFEYMLNMYETIRRYGILSRPQIRGVLNCLRANAIRKAEAQNAKPEPVPAGGNVELPVGIFTIVRENGEHRTYRITEPTWGDFTDGRHIVSLLVGPSNGSDYMGVGFLMADGSVAPWKRYSGPRSELQADISVLFDKDTLMAAGKRYAMESGRCFKCNRLLTTPDSIEMGIGPVCASKF